MKLDHYKTIAAALKLVEEVGVERLTMRRLGDALGVKAAALYYHFPSKQALLDAMAETIAEQAQTELKVGETADIRGLAHSFRNAMVGVRDGGLIVSGAYGATPSVLKMADAFLSEFLALGLDEACAVDSAFNLIYFIEGSVVEQQAFERMCGTSRKERAAAEHALQLQVTSAYPHLKRCLGAVLATDFDARFKVGLDSWIEGIERTKAKEQNLQKKAVKTSRVSRR